MTIHAFTSSFIVRITVKLLRQTKTNKTHRKSFNAHREGNNEDVESRAEEGDRERDEDQYKEPDEHPQGICSTSTGTHLEGQ